MLSVDKWFWVARAVLAVYLIALGSVAASYLLCRWLDRR